MKKLFTSLSSDGANLAKVISTFLVVLGHSYPIFAFAGIREGTKYLRGFQSFYYASVPIFFLLSGYFLTRKGNFNWKNNMVKKTRSLIIPYLIFILFFALVNCIGSFIAPSLLDNFRDFGFADWIEHLFGYPFFSTPLFYEPFWFLRDLILLNILSFALVPLVKKLPSYVLIPLMLVIWFTPLSWYGRQAFSFFIIGMCFGKEHYLPVIKSFPFSVILFVIAFAIRYFSGAEFIFNFAVLVMVFAILSISNCLVNVPWIKNATSFLLPYSFITYILHQHPLSLLQHLIVMKADITFGTAFLLFLLLPFVIIGLCIAAAYIFKKVFPKAYSVCVGERH